MDVLKKVKSATFIEALVATLLIVIIFTVAVLVINNLLWNDFKNNTHRVETRLSELEYEFLNKLILPPYNEDFHEWNIKIYYEPETHSKEEWIVFAAEKEGFRKVLKKRNYELP